MDTAKADIKDLSLEELEGVFNQWREPPFRAQQVWSWIYKKGVVDFTAMSNLSSALRARLGRKFFIEDTRCIQHLTSKDGSKKILLQLKDGFLVESVSIPASKRITGCLSTQVGCKFACRFCASGLLGFRRNLRTGEIISQVMHLAKLLVPRTISHCVFMGVGEPLDNYDNLLKAIRIMNDHRGMKFGARRITISTCGIVPAIRRLIDTGLQIELSVSLHSGDDRVRSRIMPVNKRYPLADLIAVCKEYACATKRQVTFEYIMLRGINSSLQAAVKLSTILAGFKLCKVNLIPANPVEMCHLQPPRTSDIILFKDHVRKQGIPVTIRTPRGSDIQAACGQLRLLHGQK